MKRSWLSEASFKSSAARTMLFCELSSTREMRPVRLSSSAISASRSAATSASSESWRFFFFTASLRCARAFRQPRRLVLADEHVDGHAGGKAEAEKRHAIECVIVVNHPGVEQRQRSVDPLL